jgi:periplasmic divalent cation tolerance protein
MSEYVFYVTVGNNEEAGNIGRILVEENLAACVNIINNINSIYMWKEKIENDTEHLLIIKTTEEKSNALIERIQEIHSYETPECIGLKIEKGSDEYLNWIREVLT